MLVLWQESLLWAVRQGGCTLALQILPVWAPRSWWLVPPSHYDLPLAGQQMKLHMFQSTHSPTIKTPSVSDSSVYLLFHPQRVSLLGSKVFYKMKICNWWVSIAHHQRAWALRWSYSGIDIEEVSWQTSADKLLRKPWGACYSRPSRLLKLHVGYCRVVDGVVLSLSAGRSREANLKYWAAQGDSQKLLNMRGQRGTSWYNEANSSTKGTLECLKKDPVQERRRLQPTTLSTKWQLWILIDVKRRPPRRC